MISPLRKSLIVLIALLQLIAPLVHAHAKGSQTVAALGLHLPGLEFITAARNTPNMHAEALRDNGCGVLIGISCGMQHFKTAVDLPVIACAVNDFIPRSAEYVITVVNFSPQPSVHAKLPALRPIAPRAPPSSLASF